MISLFQSTRIPRGGATATTSRLFPTFAISIHAPHEGCDNHHGCVSVRIRISIHAPHEGVRHIDIQIITKQWEFQSTHPTRGCDAHIAYLNLSTSHFNPRTLRGGATIFSFSSFILSMNFNPRTPRGGATNAVVLYNSSAAFQSTHPTRGCDGL